MPISVPDAAVGSARAFASDFIRSTTTNRATHFTTPEIRRTNLASVVLQTKTLRLGKLEEFPLLDPPRPEAIREGIRTLIELGAIDERHELTEIGWKLGRMPVDPRVGRIILAAEENGSLAEILPIAAALEIHDPRDRPPGQADRRPTKLTPNSPIPAATSLSYLRLWRYYEQARGEHSRNKLTRELAETVPLTHADAGVGRCLSPTARDGSLVAPRWRMANDRSQNGNAARQNSLLRRR